MFSLGTKIYEDDAKKTEDLSRLSDSKKQNLNPFAALKAKLCSAHLSKSSYSSRIAVNKNIGLLGDSKNKKFEGDCNEMDFSKQGQSPKHEVLSSPIRKIVMGSECKSEKQSPKKHQKSCKKNNFSKSTGFLLEEQRRSCKGKFVRNLYFVV